MKRLLSLVAMLLLLTACNTAKRAEQNQGSGGLNGNLKTDGPASKPADQAAAPKPTEQTPVATAPQPTNQTPALAPQPAVQTPVAPARTESLCTWPSVATLKAKGRLLLADGPISFYKMAWGADCNFRQTVDAWLVQDLVVSEFLTNKRGIEDVKAVVLPGGEHGYLVNGPAVGAASSAYYLMVLRYGEPRLYRFLDKYATSTDAVTSTDYPEVSGDQINTAERVGSGGGLHFVLRTWRLDPQGLTATKIKETESYPIKTP